MKRYLLFDLDGTLTDPGIGITNAVMYALEKYGIEEKNREKLYPFIGPPLTESFEKYYGFSETQALQAVDYYREYFSVTGLFENKVYEGIKALLAALKKKGDVLIVATSKPEIFSKKILDHFELTDYFTDIAGSTLDGSRVKKGDVIRYALEKNGIEESSEIKMIGDRKQDICGALENHLTPIGVLYGYGSREELADAGAKVIVESVEALQNYLLEEV